MKSYGKMTELDATSLLDTAVQSGGVNPAKGAAIKAALADAPASMPTAERLKLIVPALAADAKPKYKADVLSRRSTIAALQGLVHGASYSLPDWGLDDIAIQDADLL